MSWAGRGCGVQVGICLPTFRDSQKGTARPMKHGTDGLFHNSVINCQTTSRSLPEDETSDIACLLPNAWIADIFDTLSAVQVAKNSPYFFRTVSYWAFSWHMNLIHSHTSCLFNINFNIILCHVYIPQLISYAKNLFLIYCMHLLSTSCMLDVQSTSYSVKLSP